MRDNRSERDSENSGVCECEKGTRREREKYSFSEPCILFESSISSHTDATTAHTTVSPTATTAHTTVSPTATTAIIANTTDTSYSNLYYY